MQLTSNYSKTKYEGEIFALKNKNALVIRTNITGFRPKGVFPSFIEWVTNALEKEQKIKLFDDYFTSTISTQQAAKILFDILEHKIVGRLNLASREVSSKKAFVELFAQKTGLSSHNAESASVHNVLDKRSESIGLDVTRAESLLNYKLPTLDEVTSQLASEYLQRKKVQY